MGIMRQDVDKLRSRVTKMEQHGSHTEDTVTEHSSALRTLQTELKALEYKADDAENRNRRNHHRIVGLAKGVAGTNPTVEDLLRTLLPNVHFSPYYTIERAHCILPRPGPSGSSYTMTPKLPGQG